MCRHKAADDDDDDPLAAPEAVVQYIVVEIDAEDKSHAALWTTVGLVGGLVVSIAVWVVLILLFDWPITVAILSIPLAVILVRELRSRSR